MMGSLTELIFKMPLLASKPLPLWQGMVLMVIILVVVLASVGAGGYFFLRFFATVAKKRRDAWDVTAAELGLTIATGGLRLVKPLEGVYKKHKVEVVSFGVPRPGGEPVIYDYHISCEIHFLRAFAFPFEIKSRTRFLQALSSVFTGRGIELGVPSFDNTFRVESSAPDDIRKMLLFEQTDTQDAGVMIDLVSVLDRSHSVEIDNRRTKVSAPGEIDDTAGIRTIIEDTIHIVERLQDAYAATHPAM